MVFVWQVQHFGMHAALLCGRRWALEVWCLCCVALPCNSHATHTQHTVNTTRNTSTHTSKAQRLPHERAACIPKCCTCHSNTIGTLIYQICNSDCCHDILHPLSYCQQRPTMPFFSVRVLHKKQPSDRTVDSSVGSPVPPNFKVVCFGLSPSAFRKNSHSS